MGAAIAASSVPMDDQPRPVTRSMRALLYVLTALTFFAGTQLFVYLVLGGGSLLAVVRFAGDLDFGRPGAALFVAFAISVLAAGAWSALLCLREGRYRRVLPEGGIPVELAAAQSEPAADVAANGTRAPAHR
jgi:hypothetical protein